MKLKIITLMVAGLAMSGVAQADQFNNWNGALDTAAVDLAHQQSVINSNYNYTSDNDSRIHNNDLTISSPDYSVSMTNVTTSNSGNANFANGAFTGSGGGTFQGQDNTYRIDMANVASNSIAPVTTYQTSVAPVNAIQTESISTAHDQFTPLIP